jgi:hypothetical protein
LDLGKREKKGSQLLLLPFASFSKELRTASLKGLKFALGAF